MPGEAGESKVIALPLLLLVTASPEARPMPPIAIDPCVEVDVEEVRRLAAIELENVGEKTAVSGLEVSVACTTGGQELRVTHTPSGRKTARSIELNASLETDRDAKARELALAIAELVRRVEIEAEPEPRPPPPRPPPRPSAPQRAAGQRGAPSNLARPWHAELGLAFAVARWTGGETLLGIDATGRFRLGGRLMADLRLGGRRTRPITLRSGTLDASGMAAAVGLAVDVAPSQQGFGLAVGARVGGSWLRYSAVDRAGAAYGGRDAGALSAGAGATAFVEVATPVCVTADVGAGGALHSVAIRDNARAVSGMKGVLLSGSLGVSAHF